MIVVISYCLAVGLSAAAVIATNALVERRRRKRARLRNAERYRRLLQ